MNQLNPYLVHTLKIDHLSWVSQNLVHGIIVTPFFIIIGFIGFSGLIEPLLSVWNGSL